MAKGTTIAGPPRDLGGKGSSAWRLLPAMLILAGLCIGYLMGWHHYLTLSYLAESRIALKAMVSANPVLAPLCFAAIYTLAVALSFPVTSVLTIVAGFLFGWLFGAALALVSATVGATLLFLAARSAFGDFLKRRAGGVASRLADGFRRDAFGYLLVLRLAPFIPFVLVNIAPALFNVSLRIFVAATVLGIIPGVLAYSWLGKGIDSVLVAAKAAGKKIDVSDLVTPEISLAFVALALVAALATIVRKVWASRPPHS
jgi:uncharacterized membrane protein YdjX (TVP38/TMEM64 family)